VLGVNAWDQAAGNEAFVEGIALPWLQDDADTYAWGLWDADWRDLYVLDAESRLEGTINLTACDLASEAHQAIVADLMRSAADGVDTGDARPSCGA
jgi:hypothetical protein